MPTAVVKTPVVPTVRVAGAVLDEPNAYLSYLRASSSLSEAGRATFHLMTDDLSLLGGTKLVVGQPLEILLSRGASAVKSVFKGDIVAVGFESQGAQQSNTIVVEALEQSHRFAAASDFTAYLEQKRSDVAMAIAGRHGLLTNGIDTSDPVAPYLLQHGTDFACLSELAAEIGFEWFVADKALYFRKQGAETPVVVKPSDDTLLSVSVKYTGTPVASAVKVHGWDSATQKVVTGAASSVANPAALLHSDAAFVTSNYTKAKAAFGKPLNVATMPAASEAEAVERANGVAREMIGSGLALEGETYGNADLKAGGYLKLRDLGSAVDGKYYLTEVVHEFTAEADTRTRFYSSGHRPEAPAGAASSDAWPRNGLVIATVTNLNDAEKQGRVKVKYASLGGTTESHWARIVAVGAGKARGLDVMPEVGDEVLVGFEAGDTRFPFVLGGLWSAKNTHPDTTAVDAGTVKKRLYKSVAGHQVVFGEDKNTAATFGITMETASGKTKLALTEDTITLEADTAKEMTLKAGGSEIIFGKNGALTIKCDTLKIQAMKTADVEAKQDVTLKGLNVKAEGKVGFEAKGTTAKLEALAIATVKGSMVKIN